MHTQHVNTHTLTGDPELDLKLIERLACELLLESECDSLPISPNLTLPHYGNIQILTYWHLSYEHGIDYTTLVGCFGEHGTVYYNSGMDKYWIYVNNAPGIDQRQLAYTLSLAFACIELHLIIPNDFTDLDDDNISVYNFTNYYLAPDVLLDACSYDDIASVMDHSYLPFRRAIRKVQKIQKRSHSPGKYPITILGKLLLKKFRNYINRIKKDGG